MAKLIFINLPVSDLARATAFYEAVGAVKKAQFSDDTASCMVFSDTIHAMLMTHDKYRQFASRANFLVHVKVLARLFRGKMLAMLMEAHDANQLTFFNAHAGLADKRTFKRFIAPLRRIKWVVYCKAPFAGPEQVLRYLSRYTHRIAISNRRLVAADDGAIAFRWKDYRVSGPDRWKTMRLHPHEFISRFLMHVLPPHPPLRALRQRQPRREHRDSPRTPQRRSACRRPERAAGYRHGHATCAALPLPALWRPHDRDRGVRTRLRAELASDAEQDRHVMSQTALERRHFPVPIRWPHAGSDPSRPGLRGRGAVHSLIRFKRLLHHQCQTSRDFVPCAGFWTPAATARGRVRHAGVQKPAQEHRFDRRPVTSGLPQQADIRRVRRHVSKGAKTGTSSPDGLINEARRARPWPFAGRLCQNLR
jgi:hypothetical protein